MPQDLNLGNWIREKWGSQVAFSEKLGVQQSRVSKWLSGREGVSQDYQTKIRRLGYSGPWPQEEAKEAQAPAGGAYATVSDLAELRGAVKAHVEQWEKGQEKVLQRLEDALRRIEKLERADRG